MRIIEHSRRAHVIAVATSVIVWSGAGAQSVHGVVRGAVSGAALSGVVVVLRDSSSRDLAQTVTSSSGAFTLRGPAVGSYTLRARRIGFRPSELRLRLTHGDTTLVVAMSEVPVALGAVVTRRTGQCRVHPESGSATWDLWENTEIALLNAAITLRDQPYRFGAEFVRREYDMDRAQLSEIGIRDSTIRDSRPWTSVRPEILQRSGFAVETASEMTVIAPDLTVLLSREFLDQHCFAIRAATSARPDLVGLDFEPSAIGRLVDIRGTFWLDRQSGELRHLDFQYAGFPFSMNDTLPGGRVDFTRLSTGAWFLSSWWIRAPLPPIQYLELVALTTPLPSRSVLRGDPHFRSTEFRIVSGSVRDVRDAAVADSLPLWSAPVSVLRATVAMQSATGAVPASGATVALVGSQRQAVTDSNGVAQIESLMEGEYIIDVTSSLQASLHLPPTRMTVAVVPPAAAEIHARVLSAEQAVHAVCGAVMSLTRGILVGTVTRDGAPEAQARVVVRSDVDPHFIPVIVKPSSDGTYRACDLPKGEGLTVIAVLDNGAGRVETHATIPQNEAHRTVDLVLPPKR